MEVATMMQETSKRGSRSTPTNKVCAALTLLSVFSAGCVLLIWSMTPRPSHRPIADAKASLASGTKSPSELRSVAPSSELFRDRSRRDLIRQDYGRVPLSFEANLGQANSAVKFYTRGAGYGLFLTADTAVLAVSQRSLLPTVRGDEHSRSAPPEPDVLRLHLIGSDPHASVTGAEQLPGNSNYFIGNDPQAWRANVPTFASVRYQNVYPGIDLVYYGNQRHLEYDFIVAPGRNPATIGLGFREARGLELASNGDLIIAGAGGSFRQQAPLAYQQVGESKRSVAVRYIIKNNDQIAFSVAEYDVSRPLVIDPVLDYSTYIGGAAGDDCFGIAVDSTGNAYLTGYTFSADFPVTPGSFQSKPGSSTNAPIKDAFVMKLNAAGNGVIYSTYLGGNTTPQQPSNGYDEARAIAIDSAGSAYVTGLTAAANFPTTAGAFQPGWASGFVNGFAANDAFITKLSPNGDSLVYSSYLGGRGTDEAYAITLDANNNAFVTGTTDSVDFPVTAGVVQPSNAGGQDVFVSKINSTGSALLYSTYLGGAGPDWANALAVDSAQNVYLTGVTVGPDAPVTPGAFPTTAGAYRVGSSGLYDGFVTKLNSSATSLIYSTYLGGIGHDICVGLALNAQGQVYVTGSTESNNFPVTPGAYRTDFNGQRYLSNDIFVTKFNETGSQLVYSTYISSPDYDSSEIAGALAVNANGEAYIAGVTSSTHFQTSADAVQKTVTDSDNAIILKLNATGTDLIFSTYLGGNGEDWLRSLAVDSSGAIYVAGFTQSTNFPVTAGAFRPFPTGGSFEMAGIVAKLGAPLQNVYSISGKITDTNNNDIKAVMVTLNGSVFGTQWTDSQGNYSFGNLPANGNYSVEPASAYYDFSPQSQTFNSLSANQTALFSGAVHHFKISGQITDDNGSPISGVTVFLNGTQPTLTDANGAYAFSNLSAVGSYTVLPDKEHFFFVPFSAAFTTLPADRTANFTGHQYFVISGQLVNSTTGVGISGAKVTLSGSQSSYQYTGYYGSYSFYLSPGGSYTVTPESADFSFSPTSQSFANLAADQATIFSGVSLFGNLSVRAVDQAGQGLYYVTVSISGPLNTSGVTDGSGNITFYHLRKGQTYQLSAAQTGYTFSPKTISATINGDQNSVGLFIAQLNQLKPFTSGNILATAGKYLSEYSPNGTTVQTVIVPFPAGTALYGYYLGDLVLDQNGEVEIYDGGDAASYLSGYSFSQTAWRQHAYPGWNPWTSYNFNEGIATFGNFVFVTDKTTNDFGAPQTPGLIRFSLADYSAQRFATDLTFCHLTVGQDGLLYAVIGGTAGYQINVYNPLTLALLRTITLDGAQNVHQIAVNQSGEIFATAFDVFHFDKTGKFVKSIRLSGNLSDIEISSSGQLAAASYGTITLLDQSLNILSSFNAPNGAGYLAFTNAVPPPATSIKFSAASYSVAEGAGSAQVTVTRIGDTASAASVDYATNDGTALQTRDYTASSGTLSYAPGETSKTFAVLITDNTYVDGNRTINLNLGSAIGAPLLEPLAATLTITDNDPAPPVTNPLDESQFFVRQHYSDFLSRSPDDAGLGFWMGQIDQCGGAAACLRNKRIDVSNAFFYELEFQQTGSYVYRLYRAAFGNKQPFPNPIPDANHPGEEQKVVSYQSFVQDRARVIGGADLAQSQLNLANAFVQRGEFLAKYASTLDGPGFVDAVLATIKNDCGVDLGSARPGLINLYNSGGRGAVLYRLADDNTQTNPINNRTFIDAEYNRSFVATQYFGYLRRDPDMGGFLFWLDQVGSAPLRDVGKQHAMVCSFTTAAEYQLRFSSVVTHSNAECQ
jgi:hypothetical protein